MGAKLRNNEQRLVDSSNVRNSSKFRSQNSRINLHERSITRLNDNLTRFPHFVFPSSNDTRTRSGQKLNSIYKRVPPLNSRISHPRRNSLARRTHRIPMNNSRLDDGATLGQYSGFSDRKEAFSPILLAKVESTTTRFDHVAAIKKITDSLLARGVSKLSFNENENIVENPVPSSIPPLTPIIPSIVTGPRNERPTGRKFVAHPRLIFHQTRRRRIIRTRSSTRIILPSIRA